MIFSREIAVITYSTDEWLGLAKDWNYVIQPQEDAVSGLDNPTCFTFAVSSW